ncbi:hypothetical protein B0O80DRAFT_423714 [Mortierella sp. GBAus27b]|nr:hypothetical protein BGX31_011410 [Mortierella sp. GBA43]KAI8358648.1 hypothetical protein B0O80DRAFT_423714 [Mortierella sp. GBAus27b]
MKFSLSVAILALAASQAMAVVPVPVKECQKSIIVAAQHQNCDVFGKMYNVTMADMLKWNGKLRPDCKNLDIGHPICVSVTKNDCCLNENPYNATPPMADPALPTNGTTPAPTSSTAPTTTAPAVTPAPSSNKPAATPSADKGNNAAGTKGSMLLAAAGVVLSVAYML